MTRWRPVPGFSRYEVSDGGKVRRASDGTALKGGLSSQSYPKVHLIGDDGRKRDQNIHSLMARAFGKMPEGARISHLNGDKTDNQLANLHPEIQDPVLARKAHQRLLQRRRAAKTTTDG